MPGFDLGPENLAELLHTQTRPVKQGNWAVAAVLSSTELAVVCVQPAGAVPYIGATLAAAYVGCEIEFTTGVLAGLPNAAGVSSGRFATVCTGISSSVTNGVLSTVITLADALPASPAPGDQFVVYERPPSLPNLNIAAVGGTDVPTVGGVPSVPVVWEGSGGPLGTSSNPVVVSSAGSSVTSQTLVNLSGQSEAANTAFGSFTAPGNGVVLVAVTVSAATTLALQALNTTATTNTGQNLPAGAWTVFSFPVAANDTYAFEVGAAVTVSLTVTFTPASNGAQTAASVAAQSEAANTTFASFTAPYPGVAHVLFTASAATTVSWVAGNTVATLDNGGTVPANTWWAWDLPIVANTAYGLQIGTAATVSVAIVIEPGQTG